MLSSHVLGPMATVVEYANICWPFHVDRSYRNGRHIAKDVLDTLNDFLGPPNIPSQACVDWLPIAIQEFVLEVKGEWLLFMTNISPLMISSYFRFGEELYHQWECDGVELRNEDDLPALLEVACGRGNEAVVRILLRNALVTAINWGNGPLRQAIVGGYGAIAVQLVSSGVYHRNTDYNTILEMVAFNGDTTVMTAFMDSSPSFLITARILIAALKKDMIYFLLDPRFDVKITEEILILAAEHNPSLLGMLLDRSPDTETTDEVLVTAMAKVDDNYSNFLDPLLARRDNIQVTEAILISALRDKYNCFGLVEFILSRCPSIQITGKVLTAVARNRYPLVVIAGPDALDEIWMTILSLVTDSEISERVVVAIGQASYLSKQVITLLLTRWPGNMITEGVVLAVALTAAVGSHSGGDEGPIRSLLARGPDTKVTHPF